MEDKKSYPRNISFSARELMRMTGKSESTCHRIIKKIQHEMGLKSTNLVTIVHVSEYYQLNMDHIEKFQKS